ncbi:hypothetical protein ACH33_10915 [Aneurinibacillus sp. XH2]|uniref:Uncharacterized protein n=1 Tax=Aneurinibacillus thermoaerophilus TaxID=143495 RepID=A0ABX8YFH8_ANETH|nr:hypothetical protein ACH33_10915 [Aneurinibacillus sp. XH2]QYY44120.1 hypothetical protein K3F53_08055 [Aneurinibacillus thermoaerophilus]
MEREVRPVNLFVWIVVIFAAHLAMYYALGTPSWIATSLLATFVWTIVLLIGNAFLKQRQKERT